MPLASLFCNVWAILQPSVSVGNVGQLAVDLLISTLCLEKSGYLYDDSILPVIGNDPFATKDQTKMCKLMTGAEGMSLLAYNLCFIKRLSCIEYSWIFVIFDA